MAADVSKAAGYASDVTPFLWAGLFLVLIGVGVWLLATVLTAILVRRPPRLTPVRAAYRLGRSSPQDIGLAFEEETYEVEDVARPGRKLRLAAWWIPPPTDGPRDTICVLLHSYGDARSGALAWANLWHARGFGLLLPDLRGHGDSDGTRTGGGVWEVHDVHRLLDQLLARRPSNRVVLVGVSFGGLVAAEIAATRDDIAAVVLDSPIRTWRTGVDHFSRLLGLPPQDRLARRLRGRLCSVPGTPLDTADALGRLRVPTLVILPTQDTLVSPADADAMAATSKLVWRPETRHNQAVVESPAEYAAQVDSLLQKVETVTS